MSEVLEAKSVKNEFDINHPEVRKLLKQSNSKWMMRLYMLQKLPVAWFMGLNIKSVTPYKAEATLPYGWRSQNPFRSIYFAAQVGAAEFPAGVMARLALTGRPSMSMLPIKIEAEFIKKANKTITYTCEDGHLIQETVQKAFDTGEGQVCTVTSTGRMPDGQVVAVVKFDWSFKARKS
ncbi:MAG: DUF4442 domain-containing protein [Bacteroidota bacterium]